MAQIKKIQKKQKHKAEEKAALEKYAPKRKFSTSKVFVVAIFVVALQIIVFSEIFMWHTMDSSALYALIGIAASVAGMSVSLLAYMNKSKAENTQGGIVYDQAMQAYNQATATQDSTQSASEVVG